MKRFMIGFGIGFSVLAFIFVLVKFPSSPGVHSYPVPIPESFFASSSEEQALLLKSWVEKKDKIIELNLGQFLSLGPDVAYVFASPSADGNTINIEYLGRENERSILHASKEAISLLRTYTIESFTLQPEKEALEVVLLPNWGEFLPIFLILSVFGGFLFGSLTWAASKDA